MKRYSIMRFIVLFLFSLNLCLLQATEFTLDEEDTGNTPKGWLAGVTGDGSFQWTVERDDVDLDSFILKQSGIGKFPWCVREDENFTDGVIEIDFKPLSGQKDQAGGIVWRWKDPSTYYVARANANENNISLYYTQNGIRKTITYVDALVEKNKWHTLRTSFNGTNICVSLNGIDYINVDDERIDGAGTIGVWTKADSITAFKNIRILEKRGEQPLTVSFLNLLRAAGKKIR